MREDAPCALLEKSYQHGLTMHKRNKTTFLALFRKIETLNLISIGSLNYY
jgi:hypothetical protein